jgi:hypothetical protein
MHVTRFGGYAKPRQQGLLLAKRHFLALASRRPDGATAPFGAVLDQLTLILRGFALSTFGSTKVITPSLSSALISPCSILLEIWKLRA